MLKTLYLQAHILGVRHSPVWNVLHDQQLHPFLIRRVVALAVAALAVVFITDCPAPYISGRGPVHRRGFVYS